jgi:catalase-peroxidase
MNDFFVNSDDMGENRESARNNLYEVHGREVDGSERTATWVDVMFGSDSILQSQGERGKQLALTCQLIVLIA